jgi:integrase
MGMPASDPWLSRQNKALRMRGHEVTIDVAGGRCRLRATMPPRPSDPPGTPPQQRRISLGLDYPSQATEAVAAAEALGLALERHRLGLEPFDWGPWLPGPRKQASTGPAGSSDGTSGTAAIRQTYEWWREQRKRTGSAETTWAVDYEAVLAPLRGIAQLQPAHLQDLIRATTPGSRSRRRASQAAATIARALGWSAETVADLRALGRGYSPAHDAGPRELPDRATIEALIDRLPEPWRWSVGAVATYGCRPHEALLFAEVQPTGLLRINGGKTGARQALALPPAWVARWDLKRRRLPKLDPERGHRDVGAAMARALRRADAAFRPYDLRHAWAVRAINTPQIGPSLAAKSMGHSLTVHSTIYQRWFDAAEMAAVQDVLSSAA